MTVGVGRWRRERFRGKSLPGCGDARRRLKLLLQPGVRGACGWASRSSIGQSVVGTTFLVRSPETITPRTQNSHTRNGIEVLPRPLWIPAVVLYCDDVVGRGHLGEVEPAGDQSSGKRHRRSLTITAGRLRYGFMRRWGLRYGMSRGWSRGYGEGLPLLVLPLPAIGSVYLSHLVFGFPRLW
jgi:hypothetical protein